MSKAWGAFQVGVFVVFGGLVVSVAAVMLGIESAKPVAEWFALQAFRDSVVFLALLLLLVFASMVFDWSE